MWRRLCGVETYVLRFWESQFPQLKPNKSGTGQRLYRRRDVEMALEIKRLVHADGYTLAGARTVIEQGQRRQSPRSDARPDLGDSPQPDLPPAPEQNKRSDAAAAAIACARAELREIAALLGAPAQQPARRRSRLASIAAASGLLFPS